jgi:hypothetical protein
MRREGFGIVLDPLYLKHKLKFTILLDGRGSFPYRGNDGTFLLRHLVQTGSGAHPASCPVGTRGSFSGGKATTHLHLVPRITN